jgi:signal transduction histidine kinase
MWFGLTLFSHAFPESRAPRPAFFAAFIPLAAAVVLLPFNLIIRDASFGPDGTIRPVLGPLFPWFMGLMVWHGALVAFLFARNFKRAAGKARMQMLYLATGLLCFLSCFLIFDIILPFFGVFELNLIGIDASLAFVLFAAYAIIRHQLLDIRIVFQRSLVYSLLLSCIVSFYILVIAALNFLLEADDGTTQLIGAVVTTAAGIFGVPFIERWFRAATDWIFFKETYDYAEALHNLTLALHTSLDSGELVRTAEEKLERILRADGVRILLGTQEREPAASSPRALSFPIMLDGRSIGRIEVGPKRSGDAYAAEDARLVETFAYQAATALSRAQLYEKTREHAEELEVKVRERTRELEDAQASQRQMLMDISHSLQTPLAVFQTKLEQMRRSVADDLDVRSFEQSLSSLSEFIYDVLALARLEHGSEAKKRERVPLRDLVGEVAEELGTIAASRGVTVTASLLPEPVFVEGDPKRLREALLNLASNALKYLREDGPRTIAIELGVEGTRARVVIRDAGIGIPPEDLPHVFDRFYRSPRAPKDAEGTGLGLTIVKRIIEGHGGAIHAESALGSGTTMTIELPLARSGA